MLLEHTPSRRLDRRNTSGVRGVSYWPQKRLWRARINLGGKEIWRDEFKSFEEAREAILSMRSRFPPVPIHIPIPLRVGEHWEIPLLNKVDEIMAYTQIDEQDLDRVNVHRWGLQLGLHNQGYARRAEYVGNYRSRYSHLHLAIASR